MTNSTYTVYKLNTKSFRSQPPLLPCLGRHNVDHQAQLCMLHLDTPEMTPEVGLPRLHTDQKAEDKAAEEEAKGQDHRDEGL